ncbi:MAG: hypothetical protein EA427_15770, partial [Spirochaetaceae bacterium]
LMEWQTAIAVGVARGWSREECLARAREEFGTRFNVDIGQEYMLDHVIENNVNALYKRMTAPMKG